MQNQNSKQKVFVGLSGGVDSAVSAALLKEQGYDVTGVFMKNWSGDDYGIQENCPWEEDQKMAEMVAKTLDIPFRSYNFEKEYRAKVVDYFFSEYQKGRTPNPDVTCNREIKFALFLERALADGADMIATGHYARNQHVIPSEIEGSNEANQKLKRGNCQLLKGVDPTKDQTYFLYTLDQGQLGKVLFPIGHLLKSQVRELAHKFALPNASRPDSQGICFIGEIDVQEFLRSHISTKPGEIKDIDTDEVVGHHDGVYFYTNGQREGLKIGGQAEAYFVARKDIDTNTLYVAHGHDHPSLSTTEVTLEDLHLIDLGADLSSVSASPRYRAKDQPGKLDRANLKFIFDKPQWAITSGQSLVLYDGEVCLGGGVIK